MRPRDALRSAARYHLRAFVPTAAGVGLAAVGLWYGLRSGDGTVLSPTAFAASERAVPALALVAVGLLVVAVGRTAARVATTANLVAAEVESARDDDGIDPGDLRETVSLAVQHSVADTMDVASDQIESNVETAVSRALEDVKGDSEDAVRTVVDPAGFPRAQRTGSRRGSETECRTDPTEEREVRDVSVDDVAGRPSAGPSRADEEDAGDAEDDALADPLAATPSDGEREESDGSGGNDERGERDESSNPLAEASRQASERMESLLDGDDSEFPEATPEAESDGAEILTDDDAGESALPDGVATDDATADDAEIIDAGRRDGGETAAADAPDDEENGDSDADAGMVFGTDLKDAE